MDEGGVGCYDPCSNRSCFSSLYIDAIRSVSEKAYFRIDTLAVVGED